MGKRFWILMLALLVLSGCARQDAPSQTEAAAPSTHVSQSEAAGTTVKPGWTEDVHTGLREDGSFNAGTLFIGDSLTYGFISSYLMRYELIGDARYMAVVGAPLSRFFSSEVLSGDGSLYSPEFTGLSYSDAVAQVGGQATAIYLMLGTNGSYNATKDNYIEVVDYLLETCPNATVHLQLIPYSTWQTVDYEGVNEQLRQVYEHYQAAGTEKVMLIDTFSFIGQSLGPDGIHLSDEGRDAWYTAIAAHKNNNEIPE